MQLDHFSNGKFAAANAIGGSFEKSQKKKKKMVFDTTVIEKNRIEMEKLRKKLNDSLVELMCACPHKTVQGVYRLKKNPNGGQYSYICNSCKKIVDILDVPENTMNDSVNTINRALDQIKMYLNLSDEGDIAILKKITKFQYFLINNVSRYYRHTRADGQRAKQSRNNQGPVTRMIS